MPVAITSGQTQLDELNRRLVDLRHYVDPEEFWFRNAEAKARKLLSVNALEAHNVLALLHCLTGDRDKYLYHSGCALNLNSAALLKVNRATILSNLGYFSEAMPWFAEGAAPELGEFTSRWRVGLMGAYRTLASYADRALKLRLAKVNEVDTALISKIVGFLTEHDVLDETIASMLDVAGGLLREHRVFFMGEGPEFSVWDEDELEPHLAITLRLPLPSSTALAIDEELGHRLFAGVANAPFAVMLNFESGLPSNERFAERASVPS
jgi:hypothetical protein